MRYTDPSTMIVTYNLVVGILVMLASDRIASIARRLGARAVHYARLSVFTFGSCVSALSGTILVVFHWLRLGMN